MNAIIGIHEPSDLYNLGYRMPFVFCPFCNHLCELITDAYVEKPMIWCGHECARAVLALPLSHDDDEIASIVSFLTIIGNLHTLQNIHPDLVYDSIANFDDFNSDECTFYYVPLLKIDKVINSHLARFVAPIPLTQEQIRSFIQNNYINPGAYGIIDSRSDTPINFNLALLCNSFNVLDPETPYPSTFDTSHDGPSIFLECNDSIFCRYWGD